MISLIHTFCLSVLENICCLCHSQLKIWVLVSPTVANKSNRLAKVSKWPNNTNYAHQQSHIDWGRERKTDCLALVYHAETPRSISKILKGPGYAATDSDRTDSISSSRYMCTYPDLLVSKIWQTFIETLYSRVEPIVSWQIICSASPTRLTQSLLGLLAVLHACICHTHSAIDCAQMRRAACWVLAVLAADGGTFGLLPNKSVQ